MIPHASAVATRRSLALAMFILLTVAPALWAQSPLRLTIGDAARLAAIQGSGPQAARQRTEQAEARVKQRRAELLPTVAAAVGENERTLNSAQFGFSLRDPVSGKAFLDPDGQLLGPVRGYDARASVRQTILDFSSLSRVRSARAATGVASAEATSAAQLAAAGAAALYVRCVRADARVAAGVVDSALAGELVSLARQQLAAGVGTGIDVTRALSQQASSRARQIGERSERERAYLELRRALTVPLDAVLALVDTLGALGSDAAPAEAVATVRALRERGDLRTLEQQVTATQRLADAVRAERLPSLAAFADDGATGRTTDRLLNTWTWGLQLSVPVFDGFRREGRIDEQRAALRELDVRRRDVVAQANVEVRGALLDWSAARDQLEASTERLTLAELELSQARDRFRTGVAGNSDVVTAALGLNAARVQSIDARAALLAARVSLARAQGTVAELP